MGKTLELTVRWTALLGWTALAPTAFATIQSAQGPGPAFRAYNRFAVQGIRNDGTPLVADPNSPSNGGLRLADIDHAASLRFAVSSRFDEDRDADAVWVYCQRVGSPGAVSVSLQSDDDGAPSGVILGRGSMALATSAAQWFRVPLNTRAQLVRNGVYHIVLQPTDDSFDDNNYVVVWTTRGRFPAPFQPYDAFRHDNSIASPYSASQAVLRDVADGSGFLIWQGNNRSHAPIFAVEHSHEESIGIDPGLIGQPYNQHLERTAAGATVYGQALIVPDGVEFSANYVSIFTGAAGDPASHASQPQPCGELLVQIYRDNNGVYTKLGCAPLLAGNDASGSVCGGTFRARAHWCGAYLDNGAGGPITFVGGETYYILLCSPRSAVPGAPCSDAPVCGPQASNSWDGWRMLATRSTLDTESATQATVFGAADLPTYLGVDSFAVSGQLTSTGGDCSTTQLAANSVAPLDGLYTADMAFQLAHVVNGAGALATRPMAIFDESGVSSPTSANGRMAKAGELVTFGLVNRNIGVNAPAGELYGRLFVNGSSTPADERLFRMNGAGTPCQSVTCDIPPNADCHGEWDSTVQCCGAESATLAFTMPTPAPGTLPLVRAVVEVGRFQGGVFTPDDRIPFEVRTSP